MGENINRFLPVLVDENPINETYRMAVYCIVMIIILLVINDMNKVKSYNCNSIARLELSRSTNIDNKLLNIQENLVNSKIVDITGNYIQISNNNKKYIPLNKIIIITNERKIIPLIDFIKKDTKTGVIFIYKIPKAEQVTKIILDTNNFSRYINNIKTSNISILDSDKNIVWTYNNIIKSSKERRYVDINIVEPIIKYDRPNNILCGNTSEPCDQEKQLNISLIENTWNL